MSGFRYESRWDGVKARIEGNVREGVRAATTGVTTQIVSNITQEGLVDTGNYRRSWTFTIEPDGTTSSVGSPVEYGPYLEYGTRFMPARPHVVPAADTIQRRIVEYFKRLDR